MTDEETEHVLERLEQIDEDISALREHPMVDGFRAGEALDMAREYVEVAKRDIEGTKTDE